MPNDSPPLPDIPDDETSDELVAYLDGELDEIESRAIESQLATDDAARRKAETLKKTFDLLDYLPTTEPSPNFTSRTITQLGLAAAPASPSQSGAPVAPSAATSGFVVPPSRPRHRGWLVASWSLALLASGLLGYFGHLLAKPHIEASDPTKRTSEQVRLLERLPLYLGIDDLDFARQLDSPEFFGEPETDDAPAKTNDSLTSSELEHLENAFKTYPASRQQQLRKLDEDLAELEPARQSSLLGVLERYAVWLDRLPDSYRREVLTAPAAVERLETIRVIKARLWREGLPANIRERIQNAEPAERDQLVADIKLQDARRRNMWEIARREWANIRTDSRPWPFDNDELTKRVNDYVDTVLKPRLNPVERAEVEFLRRELSPGGDWFKWYLYGNTIARLADLHPMLPEPASGKAIRSVADLPIEFVQTLRKRAGTGRRQLQQHPTSGKWPDFAETVVREAQELKVPLPPYLAFGPSKPDEYTAAVKAFLAGELANKISAAEKSELVRLETAPWPEHSRKMLELARKYDLSVPGAALPGPPSRWDQVYRNRPGRK